MNLFELFIEIGLKDNASKGIGSISAKLGKGLVTAAKIGTAAVGAASSAIAALTAQAVNSFSEYEQLAGGAQKIFNDMDYSKIATDARNAYKELGLSANQYLAVINDVGATFAATMGDEAGYEAAKTGLKAISDYASGTGKSVDELSQKFTLITRSTSSYQSIADQFSGILPATSAGFLEQAQAAGILSDSYTQLTEVPIDEYQAAVSQMLEQGVKELGLYNNTMDEAFSTISGSLAMTKGAWRNLVTGLADDNADLDMLIGNFVESVEASAKNLLPRMEKSLSGIGDLITALAPVISDALPILVGSALPALLSAGSSLVVAIVNGIVTALPALYDSLLDGVQIILVNVFGVSEEKAGEFANNINSFFETIKNGFATLVDSAQTEGTWLNEIWTGLQSSAKLFSGFLSALWEAVSAAFAWCVDQINTEGSVLNSIWEGIKTVISAAVEGIQSVITAFTKVLQGDWSAAWDTIVETVLSIGDKLYDAGAAILESLWNGLKNVWDKVSAWWDGLTFSDKNANVNVSGSGVDGSHYGGLPYVPYDGYIAELHRGERVLTAKEAGEYNNNKPTVNIVQNIYSEAKTAADLMQEAIYQQEKAVMLGV